MLCLTTVLRSIAALVLALLPITSQASAQFSSTALADLILTDLTTTAADFAGVSISNDGDVFILEDSFGAVTSEPQGERNAFPDPLGLGVDLSVAAAASGRADDGSVIQDVFVTETVEILNGSGGTLGIEFVLEYLLSADVFGDGEALADATVAFTDFLAQDVFDLVSANLGSGPQTEAIDDTQVFSYTLAPGESLSLELSVNALGSASRVPVPAPWLLALSGLVWLRNRR
ncbi:MAG: hypothetical protein KDH88_02330 [Chromatiales bacterium]|nr:hypothetical protein [Chromatiales bacterium]